MWLNRIRQNFDLALVVTFGIITNLMILPFAAYRLASGQTLAGLIDLLIVACISLGSLRAYLSHRTQGPALFLAITYSIGCVAIAYVAGAAGPLWMYAVLLSNFLLVDRMRAAAISACAIAAVAASSLALPELSHKAAFLGSSVVVCLFSFSFAWHADFQRQQLENLAALDPLTGARNRRGMHTDIEIAVAASSRNRKPLALIMFDLDHFKQINDRFGHEAGDNVLVQVASVVRRITRRNDRFFRTGGEEFALLIPDIDVVALHDIAEKIRTTIAREVSCGDTPVTASFGASVLRANESESQWRERADAAMYRAKREGRNRSVIDGLPTPASGPGAFPGSVETSPALPTDRVIPLDQTRSTPPPFQAMTRTLPPRRHFRR
jgi:diguanylate cyclase (GGDEF)-like protein